MRVSTQADKDGDAYEDDDDDDAHGHRQADGVVVGEANQSTLMKHRLGLFQLTWYGSGGERGERLADAAVARAVAGEPAGQRQGGEGELMNGCV